MIIDRLTEDMKQAMKARDRERLSVIRMLMSDIQYARIARGEDLEEAAEQKVVAAYAKKRKEAIDAYREGGRQDLADKEKSEYDIAVAYLPAMLEEREVRAIIEKHIEALGAEGMKFMGPVIKAVMAEVGSQADGSTVSSIVKEMLS